MYQRVRVNRAYSDLRKQNLDSGSRLSISNSSSSLNDSEVEMNKAILASLIKRLEPEIQGEILFNHSYSDVINED